MDSSIILWWIFCAIIGGAIGMAKDRTVSGIVWGGLLGPIGIIVVLCLPNLKKKKEEEARRVAEIERKHQMELQQAQLQQLQQRTIPTPPKAERQYRIASNGEDLGEMPVPTIKLLIKTGKLTLHDYYFDIHAHDWITLDSLDAL